ncbi:MAG: protein translocase subunit SecD [Acidobacteria bacterium]|jgi:preprotein translocase subunit SecD|nr:protein translocase subunit SecD [Acidobacteriota bacterium]
MNKSLGWKIGLIIAVTILSIVLFIPPREKINLGLDLKGGMHLVFTVETDKAVQKQTDNIVQRLKTRLKELSLKFQDVVRQGSNKIEITGIPYDDEKTIKETLEDEYTDWTHAFIGDRAVLSLKELVERDLKDQAVSQALETISNRINEFGVSEPVLQKQGDNKLLIELPGVSDKEKDRVMGLIKSAAVLELKKVENGPFETEEEALRQYNGKLPDDLVIVKHAAGDVKGYSVLRIESVITGRELKNAVLSRDEYGAPAVSFSLNAQGAKRFQTFTAANIGKKLAIVLDDRIISDPVVNAVISYDGIIQGRFSSEEASDLALKLRSGSLPAELRLEHEQVIGPSLGADSVRKGLFSCIVGFLIVVAFMIWYYKGAGINAIIALFLNLLILMGILAYFKATLTLPGIAGIILTMGMAVDANVLIFERIKEDLKAGKAPKSAIDAGFKKAFVTILDSNLTTIISAAFLFQFGTSAIKGFAVTLVIGIAASMFSAVFVSRALFDLVYAGRKKLTKISI